MEHSPILSPTVFDLHGIERLTAWKKLRDQIEISHTPLSLCASSWTKAPYVSEFIDPSDVNSWPDPWRLVLDGRYDNLAIALGMLYTLRLTERFEKMQFEIYRHKKDKKESDYFLKIGDLGVLNLSYGEVDRVNKLVDYEISKVYPKI